LTDPSPTYRTGALWAVLMLFMLGGAVSAAYVVWGLSELALTGRYLVDLPVAVAAAFLTLLCFLFVTGILYRVDRLRGIPHRKVRLFE
jgi:hypothetical protein